MAYRIKFGAGMEKDIRRLLTSQIGRAVGHLSGILDDGGSTIHETRKSLKRCRSILRLIRPGLGRAKFRECDHAFRDIARLLSHDRDTEVLTQTLAHLATEAQSTDDKTAVAAALEKLGTGQLNGYAHSQASENIELAIATLQQVEHQIYSLEIKQPKMRTFAAGFAETYRDGRKTLRSAYRKMDDEAFHTFRKSLQHHWRHCQLLSPIWPELMEVRVVAARELSQLIGLDHDLSLVTGYFRGDGSAHHQPHVRDCACTLAKMEQARIRSAAKPLAQRLYALPASDMERLIFRLWPAAKNLARDQHKTGATRAIVGPPALLVDGAN